MLEITGANLKSIVEEEFGKINTDINSNNYSLRTEAFKYFESNGLPNIKNENWKYTNIQFLNKIDFYENTSVTGNIESIKIEDYKIDNIDCYNLYTLNGKLIKEFSDLSVPGLEIFESDIIPDFQYEIGYYQKNFNSSVFYAINSSIFKSVTTIKIKNGTIIDKPVHLINLQDASEYNSFINSRKIIIAGDNSQITFLQSYHTIGKNGSFNNSVSEIIIGNNAKIYHIKIQSDTPKSNIIDFTGITQNRDSKFSDYTFTTDGNLVRNNLHSLLNSVNCETHFYGVFIGDSNNLIDNHTLVDHASPNCFSNENYRGILFDKSTGVFNGKILVRKDAQKTNAYQSNKNILASKDSSINTKPELEIYADDVKCSHGATSGALDKNSLFYLKARGIDGIKAEAMLMYAFVKEIINEVPNQEIKSYLNSIVRKKLNDDLHFINEDSVLNID